MKTLAIVLVLLSAACGGDPVPPCESGTSRCSGATAIQDCVGGSWQAPNLCDAVCLARGMAGGACLPAARTAECACDPACTLGETKCEGLNLRTCTASGWETAACDAICASSCNLKATGCAFDSTKNADQCKCEAPPSTGWGESCANKACPASFVCITYGGAKFCTQNCPTLGTKCAGAPAGTNGLCLIQMSDNTLACAFLCKTKTASCTCPGALTCSSTENPAGSGQFPCLP